MLAAAVSFAPPLHIDGIDPSAGRADLQTVRVGQAGTELELRVRLAQPVTVHDLAPRGPLRVCLRLAGGPNLGEQLCLAAPAPGGGKGRLLRVVGEQPLSEATAVDGATVLEESSQVLSARVAPRVAGLRDGTHRWVVESLSSGLDCTTGPCTDRFPQVGALPMRTGVLVQPRCFGAASRDAARPCRNPALDRIASPTPDEAPLIPNADCTPLPREAGVPPCSFGWPAAEGRPVVALLGDSHAMHWRAAAEVLAVEREWQGISLARTSCPFTLHPTGRGPGENAACARHVRGALRWLRAHPEAQTVVISSHTLPVTAARIADYRATWRQIPASVRRILVIRDTPVIVAPQADCVRRALARGQAPGMRCAQPRSSTVRPDPEAMAARAAGGSRIHLLDFTAAFCGPALCPATVGGALVRKDGEHLTQAMSLSLGPQLVRAARRAGA